MRRQHDSFLQQYVCVCVQVAGNIYMCGIAVNLYVDQNGMLRSGGFVCV